MGYSRKNPYPHDEALLKILIGGRFKQLWKFRLEEGSEPKNTFLGATFDFIDVSIVLIDKFSKNCFAFSSFIIISFKLQTSYHIYFKFPSIGSPSLLFSAFVEATCDDLKISRKIT